MQLQIKLDLLHEMLKTIQSKFRKEMCVACAAPLSMDEVCETLTPEVAVFQQPGLAAVGVSGALQHATGFDKKLLWCFI